MKMNRILCAILLFLFAAAAVRAGEDAGPVRNGRVVEAERIEVEVAPTGLPKQITIPAATQELPLLVRGDPKKANDAVLRFIGRGAQLRAPIRIEVLAGGETQVATADKPLALDVAEGAITASGRLSAGPATIDLSVRYDARGALWAEAGILAGGPVESIDLVIEPIGLVDTIIPGAPVEAKLRPYRPAEFAVPGAEGVVWQNTKNENLPEGTRIQPGVLSHCFLGSGDRGFTWITDPEAGWEVDEAAPTMLVERDRAGEPTWRIRLVNTKGPVKPKRTLSFGLVTHPNAMPAADGSFCGPAWTDWPDGTAKTADAAFAARKDAAGAPAVLRADAAPLYEGFATHTALAGPAGGDAVSAETPYCDTYPPALTRYLAGCHTAQTARIHSNGRALIAGGEDPAVDRTVLARALLHGTGVSPDSLAHPGEAARILEAMQEFGLFDPAARKHIEFVPYWRVDSLLHYGTVHEQTDAFRLDADDPFARVHVSLYIRELPDKKRGNRPTPRQTMIVIANEGDEDVRDQLYVTNYGYLFGTANQLKAQDIVGAYDYTGMEDRICDWSPANLHVRGNRRSPNEALRLMEDDGFIRLTQRTEKREVYGAHLFVPRKGFILLYGDGVRRK